MTTRSSFTFISALLPSWLAFLVLSMLGGGGLQSGEMGRAGSLRFDGRWEIDKDRSTAIDPWKDLTVEIEASEDRLALKRIWKGHYGFSAVDSVRIPIDGASHPVSTQMWPDNRHVGVFVGQSARDGVEEKSVSARWRDDGRTLQVTTKMSAAVSQGQATLRVHSEYRLGPNGQELNVLELRSTRPRPIRYVLTRETETTN